MSNTRTPPIDWEELRKAVLEQARELRILNEHLQVAKKRIEILEEENAHLKLQLSSNRSKGLFKERERKRFVFVLLINLSF